MDDLKQTFLEKSTMFWIRQILRLMAWVILVIMVAFTIVKPIMNEKEIHFSTGDKQVYFWCGVTLLAIELIKKVFEMIIKSRSGSDNKE